MAEKIKINPLWMDYIEIGAKLPSWAERFLDFDLRQVLRFKKGICKKKGRKI